MRAEGAAGGWFRWTAAAAAGAGFDGVEAGAGCAGLLSGATCVVSLLPPVSEELSPAAATVATAGMRDGSAVAATEKSAGTSVELGTGTSCVGLLLVFSAFILDTHGAVSELEGSPDIVWMKKVFNQRVISGTAATRTAVLCSLWPWLCVWQPMPLRDQATGPDFTITPLTTERRHK